MSDNAIVITTGETFIEPAADLATLNKRYTTFNSFVKQNLRDGVDFQVIPGTGTKPSLVKPGAEKLCALFGLSARFAVADITEDWTGAGHNGEPFFYYRYRCTLYRGTLLVSECEGSCNSWEKKYRYRANDLKCPTCGKTTIIKGKEEYGGGWICFAKKGGCGAKFAEKAPAIVDQPRGQIPNPDIADQVNTLQKMAQKRAFVGATLLATNASEYFTQDIEDMPQFVEAVYVEAPPAAAPQTTKPAAPVATLPPLTKPAPMPAEAPAPAAPHPAPADDHVVYTGYLANSGGKNGRSLPPEWVKMIAMNYQALGESEAHLANIVWTENIPQDTTPERVLEIVKAHLAQPK